MNQATAYMAALSQTTNFSATQDELILRAGDQTLATFAVDSQDLADTAWEVTSYNNGRMAVVGVLPGTEISAYFGADGRVSGNAGCNQYFAGYTVNGNAIEIGRAGTTTMLCPEPPGVMEQETAFLQSLEMTAAYQIQGDTLILLDANGVNLAELAAAP